MTDYRIDEYEIVALQTLENVTLRYIIPKKETVQHPTSIGSVNMKTDRPVNNVNFSLSGKGEQGTINFTAVDTTASGPFQTDRSAGTLQDLIDNSSTAEADVLRARFGQDSGGDYVVRTITEQEIWLREYMHNPGATATWRLFGPAYSFRKVDGVVDPTVIDADNLGVNPSGCPIFMDEGDIEPNPQNPARGAGIFRFKVGGRL